MEQSKAQKTYFYPIRIEAHKEGGYHANCPILEGAFVDGETIEEAVENLRDVIRLILKYKEERERKKFYVPSLPIKKVKAHQDLSVTVTL